MAYHTKSKFFIFSYFVIILLSFNHYSYAQKEYDKDTPDSVIKASAGDENNQEYADTLLKRTLVDYESDSIQKWKQRREFAYINYLDSLLKKRSDIKADTISIDQNTGTVKRKSLSSDNSGINKLLNSLPLKIFFWGLAVLFIGLIFHKIFFNNDFFNNLKNKPAEADNEDSLMNLADVSKYDLLILEAETKNNFNLSTRYLYLQTLKILSDKGFINFSPDKTNKDYLHEMASHTYQKEFAALTRNYEYVWYGKFLINQFQYQKLKTGFIEFLKQV